MSNARRNMDDMNLIFDRMDNKDCFAKSKRYTDYNNKF